MEELVESSGDGYLSGDDGKGTSGQGRFCTCGTQLWLARLHQQRRVTQCDVTPRLDEGPTKSSFSRLYEAKRPTASKAIWTVRFAMRLHDEIGQRSM